MKNFIIVVKGFIGDILFASSIAKQLYLQEYKNCGTKNFKIIFIISLEQPYELLKNNEFIDEVYINEIPYNDSPNNIFYYLKQVDQSIPATIQFQQSCNIINKSLQYEVYTNKHLDELAKINVNRLRKNNKKVIAYCSNWEERSFLFTEQQYIAGINVINLGYGGKHRDINFIIKELNGSYNMLEIGFPNNTRQDSIGIFSCPIFTMTASILKNCDYMIGPEGGLTNLAAGLNVKTIITSDFIWQLYGPNGCIKKINNPQMGPKVYFPDSGHEVLDPFLTDKQIIDKIKNIIG